MFQHDEILYRVYILHAGFFLVISASNPLQSFLQPNLARPFARLCKYFIAVHQGFMKIWQKCQKMSEIYLQWIIAVCGLGIHSHVAVFGEGKLAHILKWVIAVHGLGAHSHVAFWEGKLTQTRVCVNLGGVAQRCKYLCLQ